MGRSQLVLDLIDQNIRWRLWRQRGFNRAWFVEEPFGGGWRITRALLSDRCRRNDGKEYESGGIGTAGDS